MVDSQCWNRLGDRAARETQIDGRGVAAISWVMGRYSRLVMEMEVVVFQPVDYRVCSSGGTGTLWKGTLPPHMMCIEVTHKDAVLRELNGVYD
jgi:hypothetical protein